MNKSNIMLVNTIENNIYDNITNHKFIQEYINNLTLYPYSQNTRFGCLQKAK